MGDVLPYINKLDIDNLEELRQKAKKEYSDNYDNRKLNAAVDFIAVADAYFTLFHDAVNRAEDAFNEYRKEDHDERPEGQAEE